jgi:hypothetical protein
MYLVLLDDKLNGSRMTLLSVIDLSSKCCCRSAEEYERGSPSEPERLATTVNRAAPHAGLHSSNVAPAGKRYRYRDNRCCTDIRSYRDSNLRVFFVNGRYLFGTCLFFINLSAAPYAGLRPPNAAPAGEVIFSQF